MAKSRDSEGAGNKAKARLGVAGGSSATASASPADATARSAGPTRRQVRQIARLVGRLEVLGELEAKRRRQLQVALEKGRKTKRHRQQVDRAAGRVGELIDRLRTLARELDSPLPLAAAKPAPKADRKTSPVAASRKGAAMRKGEAMRTSAASKPAPARTAAKPAAALTPAKPAAPRARSKPANA